MVRMRAIATAGVLVAACCFLLLPGCSSTEDDTQGTAEARRIGSLQINVNDSPSHVYAGQAGTINTDANASGGSTTDGDRSGEAERSGGPTTTTDSSADLSERGLPPTGGG